MADNSVERDALPEDQGPLSVRNEPQNVDEPIDAQESDEPVQVIQNDIPAPNEDLKFKRMLQKISEELTDENLVNLKDHLTCEFGNALLEKIKKPEELSILLEERHWLTKDNLLKLQAALRNIGRMDIVNVDAEYAQTIDNVLCHNQPSESATVLLKMADNSDENDTLPKVPIPVNVQNEPKAVDRPTDVQESEVLKQTIEQDFGAPTEDWVFKRMLMKLSKELNDKNLKQLKYRFSGGISGLGKGVQENIKEPEQLFTILEERHWLTRDNLLKLQAALRDIGRMDLVRVTAEYAQRMDNVLYFYEPSESETGHGSIKLHLCKYDYKNADRNHIQLIRLRFSELVGCALEDIVIVGLEPATSLILTLHVPETFVCMFKELLKMSSCKGRLRDIGIDMVEIEGEDGIFYCSDEDVSTKTTTEEQKKLYNVYQLLENKSKLLYSAEVKLLELNETIKKLQNEKFQREALLKSMKPEIVGFRGNMSSNKDDLLKQYYALLQRPEMETCDKSYVMSLLDVNSEMTVTVVAKYYESVIQEMRSAEKERMEFKLRHMELEKNRMESEIEKKETKPRNREELYQLGLRRYMTSTDYDEHIRRGQPNKKSGYDSIPHAESDSNEAKRTDLPEVKEMYQHLGSEPKRIADKTESESKREHTVSNIGKEDADSQVTKSMSQILEMYEEISQYSLEMRSESGYIGDSSSLTESDFDEDAYLVDLVQQHDDNQ